MKLAMCQTDMLWENKEKNLEAAEEYIKEAADNSADLIIFPEMSFTGFSVKTAEPGEEYGTSKTVEKIKLLAAENEIAVGFGMTVSEKGTNLNRFVVANKDGEEVGYYDKIHPFSYGDEGRLVTGGEETKVVTVEGVKIALYVCYDLRFPEIFSAVSNKADMAVVIANWPSSRISQWNALLRARAIENQYYTMGVNRTGTGDGIEYNGRSAAFDYAGALMAEAGSQQGLTYCEIFPENVSHFRNKFKMLCDRKPELYKKLLN